MPGVPDVVFCDEQGQFHFMELKSSGGKAVDLSPHQVSWLSNHSRASVWVFKRKVQTPKQPEQFFLYHGRDAMDLMFHGLDVKPVYHSEGLPDWEAIFELISPIPSHKMEGPEHPG